ncbi:hypothetical protein EJB05_21196, partial [Eragrostis curvula]
MAGGHSTELHTLPNLTCSCQFAPAPDPLERSSSSPIRRAGSSNFPTRINFFLASTAPIHRRSVRRPAPVANGNAGESKLGRQLSNRPGCRPQATSCEVGMAAHATSSVMLRPEDPFRIR